MISATPPETVSLTPNDSPFKAWRLLFANQSFVGLWLGQLFSQLADRIIYVVFLAYLVQAQYVDEAYTSYLYVAFTLPAIALTAVAGVFVDRVHKPTLLFVTNVVRALLVVALPWAASLGLLPLYGLAFALSCVTQFFVPAESAMIPTLVPKPLLTQANSLFTTTMMGSVIFGFALGDPLIHLVGLGEVHWAVGGLFTLAGVCLLFLFRSAHPSMASNVEDTSPPTPTQPQPRPSTVAETWHGFFDELKTGLAYIVAHKPVWQAMAKLALLFSAVVALCILCISFTKHFLYDNPLLAARKFAYLIAASGVGMAIGALTVGSLPQRLPRLLIVYTGMTILGVALVGLGCVPKIFPQMHTAGLVFPALPWAPSHEVVVFSQRMLASYTCALMMGLGAAAVAIPLQALLHEVIPEHCQGKVLGVQFTLLSTSSTLPALFAGFGSQWLGVQTMFILTALPFVVWGAIGLCRASHVLADSNSPPAS